MSISSGRGILIDAHKELVRAFDRVRQTWDDQNARQFEERYVRPLDNQVRLAVTAMQQLADAAHAAKRDCD